MTDETHETRSSGRPVVRLRRTRSVLSLALGVLVSLAVALGSGRPVQGLAGDGPDLPAEPLGSNLPPEEADVSVADQFVAGLTDPELHATHAILVENKNGGGVYVYRPGWEGWQRVGSVKRAASSTLTGWAASRWSVPSSVAASASHAIRVAVGEGGGAPPRTVSLVPLEFANPPRPFRGYTAGTSGIWVDIGAGTEIFREQGVRVGSPAFVWRSEGLKPLGAGWRPVSGDRILICGVAAVADPGALEFENRAGGEVTAVSREGLRVTIARVARPVVGIGRFDATQFSGVGQVNTNHSGVVTISTAARRKSAPGSYGDPVQGGFQIQPSRHAAATEQPEPQVMVVEPLRGAPTLEGQPPLFRDFLALSDAAEFGACHVEARVAGVWQELPPAVGRQDGFFLGAEGAPWMEAFRIRFAPPEPALCTEVTPEAIYEALPTGPWTNPRKPGPGDRGGR